MGVTIIHQAIFGDKDNAYGLLKTTGNVDIARRVANSTDMYEQTPDNVLWNYTLRGFAWEDYYLLMRTFTDKSSTVRKGRVYSHCLMLPIEAVTQITDLTSLLIYLPVDAKKDMELVPIQYVPTSSEQKIHSKRVNFLINKLIYQDSEIYAWVDYDGYEEAITVVWNNVSERLKPKLRFGIGFNPLESERLKGIKILTVPARLIAKWNKPRIALVNSNDEITPASEAEDLLCGQKEKNQLGTFIDQCNIELEVFSDYAHLQKVLNTLNNLQSANLNSLLTLIDTVSVYSNKGISDQSIKHNLVSQIKDRLQNGTTSEIIRVRNEGFKLIYSKGLIEEIAVIIYKRVINLITSSNTCVLDLAYTLIKPNIELWWYDTVNKALLTFFDNWRRDYAEILFELIDSNNAALMKVADELIPGKAKEADFVTLFKGDKIILHIDPLLQWARNKHWSKLHAHILLKTKSLLDAISMQISAFSEQNDLESLEIITSSYPFSELFEVAKNVDKSGITSIIVRSCLNYNFNLKHLDLSVPYWQKIALKVIEQDHGFRSFPIDHSKVLFDFLDSILNGKPYEIELLTNLSEDPYAELYTYSHRVEIWSKLPVVVQKNFLRNTALYFLSNEDVTVYKTLEDELKEQIRLKDTHDTFTRTYKNNITKVLPILGTIINNQKYIADYIYFYNGKITATESTLLGQLIRNHNWEKVADAVYIKSKQNYSFRNSVSECYELLNFFDRLTLSFSGNDKYVVSDEEWWAAFLGVVLELFPEGPKDRKVWEEAGGKLHDLNLVGSGKQQWIYALEATRKGSLSVDRESLLNTMLNEFKGNPHLNLLKKWIK